MPPASWLWSRGRMKELLSLFQALLSNSNRPRHARRAISCQKSPCAPHNLMSLTVSKQALVFEGYQRVYSHGEGRNGVAHRSFCCVNFIAH